MLTNVLPIPATDKVSALTLPTREQAATMDKLVPSTINAKVLNVSVLGTVHVKSMATATMATHVPTTDAPQEVASIPSILLRATMACGAMDKTLVPMVSVLNTREVHAVLQNVPILATKEHKTVTLPSVSLVQTTQFTAMVSKNATDKEDVQVLEIHVQLEEFATTSATKL